MRPHGLLSGGRTVLTGRCRQRPCVPVHGRAQPGTLAVQFGPVVKVGRPIAKREFHRNCQMETNSEFDETLAANSRTVPGQLLARAVGQPIRAPSGRPSSSSMWMLCRHTVENLPLPVRGFLHWFARQVGYEHIF